MPENTLQKAALRRALIANRQAIAPEVRRQWDQAIGARVLERLATHKTKTLGVYWPIRGEPDLRATYTELAARGLQLALPLVVGKEEALRFAAWTPGDPLSKDALGVAVPVDTRKTVQPDMLLVPCVGFNAMNLRLGYGGGFYDRTLAVQPRPLAVGIAYECGLVEFDGAAHDIALDEIITERRG
ncbi:MAG: 5-formyltetrahydrofolate cyclo-ligase [Burkholderiales bacterium]